MNADARDLGVSPLERLFDRIVVINLAHRRDRFLEMQAELRGVGVAFPSRTVARFDAIRPSDAGPFSNIGTHGCFLSHLGALEESLAAGVQSVLIVEDDCSFVQDFNAKLEAIASELHSVDWCLLHGGANSDELLGQSGLRPWKPGEHIQLAHFLGVRGQALKLLPDYLRTMLRRPAGDPLGGPMHVDGAYSWFRESHPDLQCYVAQPRVAYQRSSKTDIHDLSWRDRMPFVRSAMSLLRRAKNRFNRAP